MNNPNPAFRLRNRLHEGAVQEAPHWDRMATRKVVDTIAMNLATDMLIDSGIPASSLPPRFNILLIDDPQTVERVCRRIAAVVGRCCYVTSLAYFASTGYMGMSQADLAAGIFANAGRDRHAAEHSLVVLTNVESIASRDLGGQSDVAGTSVQRLLHPVLRGSTLSFGRSSSEDHISLDSSRMTFVVTGELPDLREALQRRLRGGYDTENAPEVPADACVHVAVDELQACKFEASFVRCFPVRSLVAPCNPDSLADLLVQSGSTQVAQMLKAMRDVMGINVTIEPAAARDLMRAVMDKEGDAEGIHAVLWDLLVRGLHEEAGEIRIDAAAARGEVPPWTIPGNDVPGNPAIDGLLNISRRPAGRPVSNTGFTDTAGLTDAEILRLVETIMEQNLDFKGTIGSARKWWEAVLQENTKKPALVLRLCEELRNRKASVTEFFLAYVYSNSDGFDTNLAYLDYTRLKKEEERRKRKQAEQATAPQKEDCSAKEERPATQLPAADAATHPGAAAAVDTLTLRDRLLRLYAAIHLLQAAEQQAQRSVTPGTGTAREENVIRYWRNAEDALRSSLRALQAPGGCMADYPKELGERQTFARFVHLALATTAQVNAVLPEDRNQPAARALHSKTIGRLAWLENRMLCMDKS